MYTLYLSWVIMVLELSKHIAIGISATPYSNKIQCGNFTCLNNATCSRDGLSCLCLRGFQGITCNEDFDECSLGDPCLHRGHCQNSIGTYRCECLKGWTGESDHCKFKDNSTFQHCTQGWMGDICQDRCLNDSMCQNSGVCTKRNGRYRCVCEPGWEGITCTDDIDECASNPCSSRRTCINTPGSFYCVCIQGWTGPNCHDDIDECKISKCMHSSSCENTPGSYRCYCYTGWSGLHCKTKIDKGMTISRIYTTAGTTILSVLFGCSITVFIGVLIYKCCGNNGNDAVRDALSDQTPNRREINNQRYQQNPRHEQFNLHHEYHYKQQQNVNLHVHLNQPKQEKAKQDDENQLKMSQHNPQCRQFAFNEEHVYHLELEGHYEQENLQLESCEEHEQQQVEVRQKYWLRKLGRYFKRITNPLWKL